MVGSLFLVTEVAVEVVSSFEWVLASTSLIFLTWASGPASRSLSRILLGAVSNLDQVAVERRFTVLPFYGLRVEEFSSMRRAFYRFLRYWSADLFGKEVKAVDLSTQWMEIGSHWIAMNLVG